MLRYPYQNYPNLTLFDINDLPSKAVVISSTYFDMGIGTPNIHIKIIHKSGSVCFLVLIVVWYILYFEMSISVIGSRVIEASIIHDLLLSLLILY